MDETYIGGKARNMHKADKVRKLGPGGKGSAGKSIVMGLLERGGLVRVIHVPDQTKATLDPIVREHVIKGSPQRQSSLPTDDNYTSLFLTGDL